MDFQIICFLEIIKSVIRPSEKCREIKDVNWNYMVQLAKAHNLLPIFFEGSTKYASYTERVEYANEMREVLSMIGAQVKRTNTFLELYEEFVKEGIHPIVMKGLICRELYGGFADHRPSGDEDILIRLSEYKQVKEVLISNGYMSEVLIENEEQLERLQEITFFHPQKRLHIELHLNPMGRENDVRSKMSDYFLNAFENCRDVEINGVLVRTMNHQEHLLYLILHAFKHFISGGFGVRQMLDILLYQEQYGAEIDLNHMDKVLQSFGASIFWADMIHIGNFYFGFELSTMQTANCPEELLEDMILCGAFGNNTLEERTAERTIKFATGNHLKKGRSNSVAMMWKAIFPKRVFLLNNSPYLEKKPWLLPVAWVQRWGRFLKRIRRHGRKLATESMKISQRRMKLLKKYNLI